LHAFYYIIFYDGNTNTGLKGTNISTICPALTIINHNWPITKPHLCSNVWNIRQ